MICKTLTNLGNTHFVFVDVNFVDLETISNLQKSCKYNPNTFIFLLIRE